MKILGITGGVGSGKSKVLHFLEDEYGAVVCQLDEVAKELQKKGGVCYQKIIELFGTEIIGTDGELDRSRLAALIFQDVKMRQNLTGFFHP